MKAKVLKERAKQDAKIKAKEAKEKAKQDAKIKAKQAKENAKWKAVLNKQKAKVKAQQEREKARQQKAIAKQQAKLKEKKAKDDAKLKAKIKAQENRKEARLKAKKEKQNAKLKEKKSKAKTGMKEKVLDMKDKLRPQDYYTDKKYLSRDTAQGSVALYTHKDSGHQLVVKIPHRGHEKDIILEKIIYRYLDDNLTTSCKHLFPKHYDFKGDFDGHKTYLALEYVKGRELSKYLDRHMASLSGDDKYRILQQVQNAVRCMFKAGVIHGDLHASNIMITDDNRIKIFDFGTAMIHDKLKDNNFITGWFVDKHANMYKRYYSEGHTVSPGNPNIYWLGYKKPFYARHHARHINKLLDDTSLGIRNPVRDISELKRLARHLLIKDVDSKSKDELLIEINRIPSTRIDSRLSKYTHGRNMAQKRNGASRIFRANVIKKVMEL